MNHTIYWLFDQINHNYKQIMILILDYICIYLDTVFVMDLSQNENKWFSLVYIW